MAAPRYKIGPATGTKADFDDALSRWAGKKKDQPDPTPFKVFKVSKAGRRIGTRHVREFSSYEEADEFVTRERAEGINLEIEPKMDKPKISESRLREIVNEELHRARLRESGPDHEASAKVVGAASKLLKALDAFVDATNELPAVANSTGAHIEALRASLAHMVETPGAYSKKPSEPKVVQLRSQTANAL